MAQASVAVAVFPFDGALRAFSQFVCTPSTQAATVP